MNAMRARVLAITKNKCVPVLPSSSPEKKQTCLLEASVLVALKSTHNYPGDIPGLVSQERLPRDGNVRTMGGEG